jgi:uncharacterized membrane protein
MTKYELLLSIHLLAVIVWVGGSIFMLALGYHLRSRDIETRVEYTRWTEWLAPRMIGPASVLVLVAGILLIDEAGYDFSDTFISIGLTGWIVSFLLGVGFYPRAGAKREKLIEQHGPAHEAVAASLQRVLTVATVDTLIVVLVVLDMTTKPGL